MNDSQISIRYAKALFELALEKDILEKIFKDIELIKSTIFENIDFNSSLKSPVIPTSKKQKLLTDIFSKHIAKETIGFLNLVLKNKRETYLENIIRGFEKLYRDNRGIKSMQLTSATPVNKEIREQLSNIVGKALQCEIEVEEKVDADIIGGFVLRIQDLQYNASISSQLNKMRQTLLKA